MKNKLWIYGCSYSNDAYFPRYDKGWFDYIADEFNLEYMDRTQPGYGWSYHKDILYGDIPHWGEDDIIIVESSHLVRMYSPYLQTRFCQFKYFPEYNCVVEDNDEKYLENLLYISKDIDEIRNENWMQFTQSLQFLKKYVKRWYWWSFEFHPNRFEMPKFIEQTFGDKFLTFENGIKTFDNWMRKNPSYCFDRKIGDLHQTYECHKKQGELFINQIKEYERQ
jgi:hypothetical protein